jgi:hypothetical protein
LLDQVLAQEPDHDAARRLRDSLLLQRDPSVWTSELLETVAPDQAPPSSRAESDSSPLLDAPNADVPTDPQATQSASAPSASGESASEGVPADLYATPVESEPDLPEPAGPSAAGEGRSEPGVLGETVPPPSHTEPPTAELRGDVIRAQADEVAVGAAAAGDTLPPPAADSEMEAAPIGREPTEDTACLLLGADRSHCVYWELSRTTREGAERLDPSGEPVIKVLFFTPDTQGTRRTERNVSVTGATGTVRIESPSVRTVLCAALGWQSDRGFQPLAVAAQFAPTGQLIRSPLGARARQRAHDVRARALGACRSTPRLGWSPASGPAELDSPP